MAEFERARARRFGSSNPEAVREPFWEAMVLSGATAYEARTRFQVDRIKGGPVWCASRFGQSLTLLADGRIVEIGGEHEDAYMPDFCIYNDVFVHEPDGKRQIFCYPMDVFPPTDFHTATEVDGWIYVIGGVGYQGKRRPGETPVYRWSTKTFEFEVVPTTGSPPGWIYLHRTSLVDRTQIRVHGGKVVTMEGDREDHADNDQAYILDLNRSEWRSG